MKRLQEINQLLWADRAVMYIVSGNHDQTDPHWVQTLFNPIVNAGIHLLDFKLVHHAGPDGGSVSFYGVPFMAKPTFKAHAFQTADVLVMHQQVTEFADFPSDNALNLDELPIGYKLIAIGDIHVHKVIERPGHPGCYVGYPGSTELKSETENSNKYWVECEMDVNDNLHLIPRPIQTRPVFRVALMNAENPNVVIEAIENLRLVIDPADRPPIIFITYLNTIPGVMEQFKTAFDPNEYILRFDPIFGQVLNKSALADGISEAQEMTIDDILRNQMTEIPDLFGIASQLINQDVDANAALDEFIEGKLRAIEAASKAANV